MLTFTRVSVAVGSSITSNSSNYFRRTCISYSYKGGWINDDASDHEEPGYPTIVYAYSIPRNETIITYEGVPYPLQCYDVYWYSEAENPYLEGECYNTFQNSISPSQGKYGSMLEDVSGIEDWDFSGVTSLKQMFSMCERLDRVSFGSNANLSNVTTLEGMFNQCERLEIINWGATYDFSKVTNMSSMFNSCSSLTSVDFGTSVNYSKVNNLSKMFQGCSKLTSVNFGSTADFTNVTDVTAMFKNCTQLTESTIKNDIISKWVLLNKDKITASKRVQTIEGVSSILEKNIESANEVTYTVASNGDLIDPTGGNNEMRLRNLGAEQFGQDISFSWDVMFEKNVTKYTIKYIDDDDEVDENDEDNWTEIYEIEFDKAVTNTVSFYNPTIKNAPKTLNGAKKYKIIATLSNGSTLISSYISLECSTLPVELTYFDVSQQGNDLFFEWETATETNNDYFTIEQSIDGVSFYEVARIAGAGTTSWSNSYNYTMPVNYSGLTYFRLKQTDYNGEYSYSDVQSVFVDNNEYVRLYPTVASEYVTIEGDFDSVEFCDAQGKIHHPTRMEGNSFPVSTLPKGMHFAIISLKNGEIITRQFMRK